LHHVFKNIFNNDSLQRSQNPFNKLFQHVQQSNRIYLLSKATQNRILIKLILD